VFIGSRWLGWGCLILGLLLSPTPRTHGADWPQWGGHDSRNPVSEERGLPNSFVPGKKAAGIDLATTRNVKWAARLGMSAYGNPTVAGGRVFIGTDDRLLALTSSTLRPARGGMIQCLDEKTGRLLWRLPIPMRTNVPKDVWFTHQYLGVCSSPTVEGDRVYVISSAGDVLCLDADGQADGNDGPFTDEGRYMAPRGAAPVAIGPTDGDIIWRFDPMDALGVQYHDAASCSVLIDGEVLYTGTSNGVDEPHKRMLNPDAPALIVLDKRTGRLVATENEGIARRTYHCQWSPQSLGVVSGKALVFFGGGDGVVYAFEAIDRATDHPVHLKKVWSYDGNPPEYTNRNGKPIPYYDGDKRKTGGPNHDDGTYVGPNEFISTPVLYNNRVYVTMGQDPAHGRGRGLLHCIDATKTGDVTQSGCVWRYDGIERSLSTPAIADGLLYVPDLSGKLHCLDADTGQPYYVFNMAAETWGGALVADGKVFVGTAKDFWVFAAGKKPTVLATIRLGSPAYSTPVAANGVLYVTSKNYLWAVAKDRTSRP
jgi:outer membrane protein assembly factor BamB